MKTKITSTLNLILVSFFMLTTALNVNAQNQVSSKNFTETTAKPKAGNLPETKSEQVDTKYFNTCPSDRLMDKYISDNHLEDLFAKEKLIRENTTADDASKTNVVRTIPVVFHIIYNATTPTVNTKITATVVNNLLAKMNADYSKTTTTGVRSTFQSLIANTNIQFCLATKDPNGAATTGIIRKSTTQTYFDPSTQSTTNGADAMKTATNGDVGWNHLNYLNIWICDITNGQLSGVAGYAYLGATSPAALPNIQNGIMIDGIVLDYNIGVFKYPGTSNTAVSSAVSHETGHYLGLPHTFATNSTACNTSNDDGFTDTPPIKGPFQNFYQSCSSGTTAPSCTSGTLWQYENLMDYSDCFVMFTTMQSAYMNNVLTNGRGQLLTSQPTACFTGAIVAPVANFNGCNSNFTLGNTVTFTDASTNIPTSWAWAITPATGWSYAGGTTSTSQNPQVTFTVAGTYQIALTATNSAGSNTKTTAGCMVVVQGGGSGGGGGGCDTLSNIDSYDTLALYRAGTTTANWGYRAGMNYYIDKAKADKFSGLNYTAGNTLRGGYFYFGKHKYASANSNINIKAWDDDGAGTSPNTVLGTKNILVNSIPTNGYVYVSFASPIAVSGDFFLGVEFNTNTANPATAYSATDTVALVTNTVYNTNNTAWEKWSDNTWYAYIDTLDYGQNQSHAIYPVLCPITVNMANADDIDDITMFPNPSNGMVSIMVGLNLESTITVKVINSLGQVVKSNRMQNGNGGKVDFDLSQCSNGVYFVEIQTSKSIVTKRLILNK